METSQEISDLKTMNDKVKSNNEATASTSDTIEQFQAVEVEPVSSMSLNSVATQTETGGTNIEVKHLFENLKKAQATIEHLENKLKHFRFDEDFFKFNEKREIFFWITKFLNINQFSTVLKLKFMGIVFYHHSSK